MSAPAVHTPPPAAVRPSAWRWVHVALAALAMVATLPGRTHGLGLFTEPILKTFLPDLIPLAPPDPSVGTPWPTEATPAEPPVQNRFFTMSAVTGTAVATVGEEQTVVNRAREPYGGINLFATLIGAAFCLPCGWLMDRFGVRAVLVGSTALLAASVLGLAVLPGGVIGLFVLVLLTRGFGQSALSVASLTLIGRSAGTRNGLAMGVYSCLTTVGFVAAFAVLREVVTADPNDWRTPWAGIGIGVLVVAVLFLLLVRNRVLDGKSNAAAVEPSRTLGQALRSPAFWAFAVGTSFYGLVVAGTSLFNESLLAERGFSKEIFLNVTVLGIPVGLVANLLGGWLATKVHLGRLFAVGMGVVAVTLAAFPLVTEEWQVYTYASGLAAGGGVITVCFFTVWRRAYGPAALGRIQGAAQLLTVLFSAVGPLLFAASKTRLGAYAPLFLPFAGVCVALAAFSWFVRVSPPSEETR